MLNHEQEQQQHQQQQSEKENLTGKAGFRNKLQFLFVVNKVNSHNSEGIEFLEVKLIMVENNNLNFSVVFRSSELFIEYAF